MRSVWAVAFAAVAAALIAGGTSAFAGGAARGGTAMKLESSNFKHNGAIPRAHTCQGADTSPALAISGAPAGTKSFALIVDDPDAPDPAAPKMVWVHWVLYNLPPNTTALPAGTTRATLPPGTREGLNDWKQTGWRGPCPPIGTHRYFFKLYALDTVLPDLGTATKAELENAMKGHVLEKVEILGTYIKS